MTRRALLMSNGWAPGFGYLEHALPAIRNILNDAKRIAFVPYAQRDVDRHTAVIAAAMAPLGVHVVGVHTDRDPRSVIESADAIMIGGGNAFRLLQAMQVAGLVAVITAAAHEGKPYIGISAGTNVACPTIRTTNDMPIVWPETLSALGLIPFQINAHYPVGFGDGIHHGVTRDKRLVEFLEENDAPVLALEEGSWVYVDDELATVGGAAGGRLFRREHANMETPPGTDVSFLMNSVPAFDELNPD
jgi:dipeptidase E